MMYCIVVALGFAALENTLFTLGVLSTSTVIQGVLISNMRFIGATLVHIVSSALIGFTLGFAFYRSHVVKFFALTIGIIAAIALHAAFNLSIIAVSGIDSLKVFAWFWVAVVMLIILFEEVKAVRPKTL